MLSLSFELFLIFQYSIHYFHVYFKNNSRLSQFGWILCFFLKGIVSVSEGLPNLGLPPISGLNYFSEDCWTLTFLIAMRCNWGYQEMAG